MSIRFLHSADWQLGMTRHFLGPEAQARFSQARIDAIRTLGTIAQARGAAFLVVSGDVFETNQVAPLTVRRTLDALGAVPVPVFLLPGNHDPLDAASVYRSRTFVDACPPHVTVLEDGRPHPVAGAEVLGAPWFSKRPLKDLVAEAAAELPAGRGVPRVLVGHGATDDLMELGINPAIIRVGDAEAALADGRLAYIALGDRHSTTAVGRSGRIWYAGAPEPTDYDETDAGNALLVELADDGTCQVEKVRTGTWNFVRERFDLDGPEGIAPLARFLAGLPAKDRTIVKLTLVGTITLATDARLAELLETSADLLGGLEKWARHTDLVVRPDDDDFSDLRLTGFAATAVDRLRERAAAGETEDARIARDALALLVRLARPASGAA